MKLPVVLIGEENIALASLRQHLAKDPDFPVDHKIQSFAEAEEVLRKKTGPVLVVVDLGREGEEAFRAAEDLKLTLPHIHLLMTSADNTPETILRALRSGAEEFFTQPFHWPEVAQSLDRMRQNIALHRANSGEPGGMIIIFSK